jgi:hypothetical protein
MGIMNRIIISSKWHEAGYLIKEEDVTLGFEDNEEPVRMSSAYTASGDYIGDLETAEFLIQKKGIAPELASSSHNICSVGFCQREQKWFGWSHRAIVGFGIGDKVFEEEWPEATDDTLFVEHGELDIETLNDARIAAVNFARSVS